MLCSPIQNQRWFITGPLEGWGASGFVMGQGAVDAAVDALRVKIGLELRVKAVAPW